MRNLTSRIDVFGELVRYLMNRGLWWLIPMIIALIVVAVLIVLATTGILSPFMYSLP